jgi:hypothetical protein
MLLLREILHHHYTYSKVLVLILISRIKGEVPLYIGLVTVRVK